MPIKVSCQCGKTINAPDNLAGKKVKCPGCSQPIAVPQSTSKATSKAVTVSCECGKSFKVKAELAGKTIKCPGCSNAVKVPGAQRPKAAPVATAPKESADLPPNDGIGDLLDEVDLTGATTGHRCPECRADLTPEDVVCIQCGYNFKLGRKMKTSKVESAVHVPAAVAAATEKKGPEIPPKVESLVKMLNAIGAISVLLSVVAIVGIFQLANLKIDGIGIDPGLIKMLLTVMAIISVASAAPYFISAHFIKKGSSIGRIIAIIIGILSLFSFPIGTLIGIAVLANAFSSEVAAYCS